GRRQMTVESYIGFYDSTGTVARDVFTLGVEFLKIQDTKIRSQNKVAVFNKETNEVQLQHYVTAGSSQSAPEQVILECGRLTKKVMNQTQSPTRVIFMNTPENNVYCVALQLTPDGLPRNEWVEGQPEFMKPKSKAPDLGITITEFEDVINVQEFAEAVKNFLEKNQNTGYGPSIRVVLRALENNVSPDSLSQALLVAKQLLNQKN
ncbi:MAG: hypothetical protein ACQESE_05270, partial [Nanobdellota archaeon]